MEHLATVHDITTGRRIDRPDELSQAERKYWQAKYESHVQQAEDHWRLAEIYARRLGYLGIERGVPGFLEPGEGQMSIEELNGEQQ